MTARLLLATLAFAAAALVASGASAMAAPVAAWHIMAPSPCSPAVPDGDGYEPYSGAAVVPSVPIARNGRQPTRRQIARARARAHQQCLAGYRARLERGARFNGLTPQQAEDRQWAFRLLLTSRWLASAMRRADGFVFYDDGRIDDLARATVWAADPATADTYRTRLTQLLSPRLHDHRVAERLAAAIEVQHCDWTHQQLSDTYGRIGQELWLLHIPNGLPDVRLGPATPTDAPHINVWLARLTPEQQQQVTDIVAPYAPIARIYGPEVPPPGASPS